MYKYVQCRCGSYALGDKKTLSQAHSYGDATGNVGDCDKILDAFALLGGVVAGDFKGGNPLPTFVLSRDVGYSKFTHIAHCTCNVYLYNYTRMALR